MFLAIHADFSKVITEREEFFCVCAFIWRFSKYGGLSNYEVASPVDFVATL
jgi:hypothetical protein